MAQQRSFQKYVSKHHENDLFDAVASFIPDNLDEIHLWSYNIDVDNLDEENVSFDDMKVEQVFVNGETLTNDIEFDVLVSGAIYFSECDRHNDYEDSCNAWFGVNCRATIDGELKNFKVHDVETYDKKKNRFHRRLSDALVPIISSEVLSVNMKLMTTYLKMISNGRCMWNHHCALIAAILNWRCSSMVMLSR